LKTPIFGTAWGGTSPFTGVPLRQARKGRQNVTRRIFAYYGLRIAVPGISILRGELEKRYVA
jgi:hypothetical protein